MSRYRYSEAGFDAENYRIDSQDPLDLEMIWNRNVVRREYHDATTKGTWETHANAGYCGIAVNAGRGVLKPLFFSDGAKVVDGAWVQFAHADDAVETVEALLNEVERLRAIVAGTADKED